MILFEVDVSGAYAIRVAGSEEALTRLAPKYAAKGYRVRAGDLLASLRALLRWDAPGDDKDGWYWGDREDDVAVTGMIDDAIQAGLIRVDGVGNVFTMDGGESWTIHLLERNEPLEVGDSIITRM